MAESLAKYFECAQGEEEEIHEVHLDRNGLRDKGLAVLLKSLASGRKNHVKTLSIFNNEVGQETLKVLAEYYLEDIVSFNLSDVKIDPEVRVSLLKRIKEGAYQLK
jgi:Ran GTPase-activating protein (RanGAP) involved in mRNA processing and transport